LPSTPRPRIAVAEQSFADRENSRASSKDEADRPRSYKAGHILEDYAARAKG
jgi:hypothetical protein